MVKNTTGGKNTKKLKRNYGKYDTVGKIEEGQMFAQITQNNGSHFMVLCSDNVTRVGKMCGSLKKGPRLTNGSFVIVSLRDFESEHKNCDIIAIGNPPNDIKNIFKKNNPTKYDDDIEFYDSDGEFKDFIEDNNENKNEEKKEDSDIFNWEDI